MNTTQAETCPAIKLISVQINKNAAQIIDLSYFDIVVRPERPRKKKRVFTKRLSGRVYHNIPNGIIHVLPAIFATKFADKEIAKWHSIWQLPKKRLFSNKKIFQQDIRATIEKVSEMEKWVIEALRFPVLVKLQRNRDVTLTFCCEADCLLFRLRWL